MNGQVQISGYEIQLRKEISLEISLLSQCQCTKCSHAASLGKKTLTIECSDTFQRKALLQEFNNVLGFMRAVHSDCNQANAMQDADTPGSLDSHHPKTLSMAPPEPPSFSQTAKSGTPRSLPEAGDPPQKSVPRQLLPKKLPLPKLQPMSQSHLKRVDSGRRAPRILGEFVNSSPGFKSSGQAMRAMGALITKIKKKSFTTRDPPNLTSSGYTKKDVQCALASSPCEEVAFHVVAAVTINMNKGESISAQDELLFFCLCKVLHFIGVDEGRLRGLRPNGSYDLSFKWYFVGVLWVNQLLEEIFKHGWGHDAVDLLLSCKYKSCRCVNEPR